MIETIRKIDKASSEDKCYSKGRAPIERDAVYGSLLRARVKHYTCTETFQGKSEALHFYENFRANQPTRARLGRPLIASIETSRE